jgi:putative peptidoglycan lipid II flippase
MSTEGDSKAGGKISARDAGLVSAAVMCSRVLGLVRELIFAKLFGAGFAMDAFVAAFRLPNLLRDLFAEGALSTAFVTVFSQKIAREGDDAAWSLANKVATMAVVLLSVVSILGVVFTPQLVWLLADGYSPEKQQFTVLLARIMFPFILLVSLAALAMGVLNSRRVFGAPSMASSYFNLGSIGGGLVLAWWMDPQFGERSVIGLALGTLVGGLWQLTSQFPALRRTGYRFRPDFLWRDEGVRHVLLLMGPAVIAASAVQVNVMINGRFASYLGDGPMSWLSFAFRLMQLPLGVFGVAIGTVSLPLISRSALAEDREEFSALLARGIRMACLLTVPSTVGLVLLAEPIVSVIYEGGKFTAASRLATASALQCYAVGLVAYSAIKVLQPTFYAIGRRSRPMWVSVAAIGLNLVFNWLFTFHWTMGYRGLALSTGFVALCNFTALYWMMGREVRTLHTGLLLRTLGKLVVACLPMGGLCGWAWHASGGAWEQMHFVVRLGWLASVIGISALSFFAAALALRVDGVEEVRVLLWGKMSRLLRRGRPKP